MRSHLRYINYRRSLPFQHQHTRQQHHSHIVISYCHIAVSSTNGCIDGIANVLCE